METAKAARERRARAPEELIKKTRARNSGAVGMRAHGFYPGVPKVSRPRFRHSIRKLTGGRI